MKNRRRITLVIFVLIGGTMSFGYWSYSQINSVFDDLSLSYGTNTASVSLPDEPDKKQVVASLPWAIGTTPTTTPANPEQSLTFPQKGSAIYIGCTYKISWQSLTPVNSLEIALIDAGMKKATEPADSGLAKENTVEKGSQNLNWKVGVVWPGEYYIAVSKMNGLDTDVKSEVFTINRLPKDFDEKTAATICLGSNGQL